IIAGADHTIELGPGAGELGGSVTYEGPPRPSECGASAPPSQSAGKPHSIRVVGAKEHNLKGIDVAIPLGQLVAITGVSGSGKSTLIRNCLYNRYQRDFRGATGLEVGTAQLQGVEQIYDMQLVDQSPIGRSTRSNPRSEHNLKGIDVAIPLGQLVAITGVSGSGKSTLIRNCLYNRYQRDFRGATGLEVGTAQLQGVEQIYDMQLVDQSPIGRSTRSNP